MRDSDAKLRIISQDLAHGWRRWASELLKNGDSNCPRPKALFDGLIYPWWMEKTFGGCC